MDITLAVTKATFDLPATTQDGVNYITPLYEQVLETCQTHPTYIHDSGMLMATGNITLTRHQCRVRLAVDALVAMGALRMVVYDLNGNPIRK